MDIKKLHDVLFARRPHVCPWWCCFTFDNPVRRLIHDPAAIVSPYLRSGSVAIDIGPGMGFFTIAMCTLVGKEGRVIAVDLQQKMLDGIIRRARRDSVVERLETRLCTSETLGVTQKADFVLAFWMVHEVPDQERFLSQVSTLLKPGGHFLLAEPHLHVSRKKFFETVETAVKVGLQVEDQPKISFSKSALFSFRGDGIDGL